MLTKLVDIEKNFWFFEMHKWWSINRRFLFFLHVVHSKWISWYDFLIWSCLNFDWETLEFFACFAIFFCVRVDFVEMIISIFYKKLLLKISYINSCTNLVSICLIFEISLIDRIELRSSKKDDSNLIVIVELFIFVSRILSLLHCNKLNICLHCEKVNFVVLNRDESNLSLIIEQLILLTFLLIAICKSFITYYEINT